MAREDVQDTFPSELSDVFKNFHNSLKTIKDVLNPLLSQNPSALSEKLTPLQRAQLDLAMVYTLNSLFWMHLRTLGENPKEHDIRQELERIKGYMTRAKNIADKEKAPKLDKGATKRFVLHSLWEPPQKDETSVKVNLEEGEGEEQEPCKKKKKVEAQT